MLFDDRLEPDKLLVLVIGVDGGLFDERVEAGTLGLGRRSRSC
ncbi:hypothetical protein [Nonomuraea basaltis]|nr:hypothetical protein [Nonomuraea basaltis]